jgi:hypothetical protein
MSTASDFLVAPVPGPAKQSDILFGSNAMSLLEYQIVKEMQRERLRQAERYRLRRLALRARRLLARQLIR